MGVLNSEGTLEKGFGEQPPESVAVAARLFSLWHYPGEEPQTSSKRLVFHERTGRPLHASIRSPFRFKSDFGQGVN
jgi:hypothetical protein